MTKGNQMRRFSRFFCGVSVVALSSACGGGGAETMIKVGQINTTSANATAVRYGLTSDPSSVAASGTDYAFAQVDGLKIQVLGVDLINGADISQAADWTDAPKEMEIGAGVTAAIAIEETVSLTPGSYTGARVNFMNSYSLKAYCRTNDKFVYTTASGIQTLTSVPTVMPSDYGYFDYGFASVSVAESAASTTDTTQAETIYEFDVLDTGGSQLAVLVDPSYLVTCFDGDGSVGSGAMSPFSWGNNNGQSITSFFPNNTANFGLSYIPIFVWVSEDAEAELPTAETYFFGTSSSSDAQGTTPDFSTIGIASVGVESDGGIFTLRARILSGGSAGLYQMFDGITESATGVYNIGNGEWMCEEGYANCGVIQDRVIQGFKRTSSFATVEQGSLINGPDCGKTGTFPGHPEWGNRYRECQSSPADLFWRKVDR